MRSRRPCWWTISVALASAFLTGCVPKASVAPELDGVPGRLSAAAGRPGGLVAAPHGISDARTANIVAELGRHPGWGGRGVVGAPPHETPAAPPATMVAELGRHTGFGVVIATGFNIEPD